MSGPNPDYDHNFMLGSTVYRLLKEHSEEASNVLHDSPYRSLYVLSEIHGVKGKPGEWWFRIGTSSVAVARIIEKALAPSIELSIGRSHFQITEIMIEEPLSVPGEYITLSPILLRDNRGGQSIVSDSSDYARILERAINLQVENYLNKDGTIKVLEFESQGNSKGIRKRRIKDRVVLAQKGRMLLNGDREQLKFLVDHGIGRTRALAFGMIVPGIPLEQIMMIGFNNVKRRRRE